MLGNRNMSSLISVNPNVINRLEIKDAFFSEEENSGRIQDHMMTSPAAELTSLVYDGVVSGRQKSFLVTGRPGFGKSHLGLYLMNFLAQPQDSPLMEYLITDFEGFDHSGMKAQLGQFLVAYVHPLDMKAPMFNSAIISALDTALTLAGIEVPSVNTASAAEFCSGVSSHLQRTTGYGGILFVMDNIEPLMVDIERQEGSELVASVSEFFHFLNEFNRFPIVFVGIGSMFPMKYITRGMEEDARNRFAQVFDQLIWVDYNTEEWVELVTTRILQHPSIEALEVLTTNNEFEKLANFAYEAGLFQDKGVDYIQHKLLPSCFPMHPFTLVFLPMLSQKVSHTEKNLMSFFRDTGAGSFIHFLETFGIFQASGKLSVFTPDYLFSYYEKAIKESPHLRNISDAVNKTNILSGNNPLARRMIRLITLMQLVKDEIVRPTKKNIFNSLQFDDREVKRMETLIVDMIQKNGFKYDRKTSEITLPIQKSSINLQEFIDKHLEKIKSGISPSELLNRDYPIGDVMAEVYNNTYYTDRKLCCLFFGMDQLRNPDYPHLMRNFLGRGTGDYAGDVAVLYLVAEEDDELSEARELSSGQQWESVSRLVIGIPVRPANFFKVLYELEALREIREREPLFADPKSDERELLEEKFNELYEELKEKLEFFRRSDRFYWYFRGNLIHQIQEKSPEELADAMMEENFPFSPVIPNPAVSSFTDSADYQEIRHQAINAILSNRGYVLMPVEPTQLHEGVIYDVLISTGILALARENREYQEYEVTGPLGQETAISAVWDTLYARILQSVEEGMTVIPLNEVMWDLLQPPYGINPALMEILLALIFHSCPWGVEIFNNFRQMSQTGDHSVLVKMPVSYETFWRMVHDPEDIIVYFSEMVEEPEQVPQEEEPESENQLPQQDESYSASFPMQASVERESPQYYPHEEAPAESDIQEPHDFQINLSQAVAQIYPTEPAAAPVAQVQSEEIPPSVQDLPVVAKPVSAAVTGPAEEKRFIDGVIELFTSRKPRYSEEPLWYEGKTAIYMWFDSLPPLTRNARIQKGKEIIAFLELMRTVGRDAPAVEFFMEYLPAALGLNPVGFTYAENGPKVMTILKNIKSFLHRFIQLKVQTLWKAVVTIFGGDSDDMQSPFERWLSEVPVDLPSDKLSVDARLLLGFRGSADLKKAFLDVLPRSMGIGPVEEWEQDRNMEYLSRLSKAKLEVDVLFITSAFDLPVETEPRMEVAKRLFDRTFNGFGLDRQQRGQLVYSVLKQMEKGAS